MSSDGQLVVCSTRSVDGVVVVHLAGAHTAHRVRPGDVVVNLVLVETESIHIRLRQCGDDRRGRAAGRRFLEDTDRYRHRH